MSKAQCPAGCGKKFVTAAYAASHADIAHPNWIEDKHKRKGWATPYGFVDFSYPVSYEDACKEAMALSAAIVWPEKKLTETTSIEGGS